MTGRARASVAVLLALVVAGTALAGCSARPAGPAGAGTSIAVGSGETSASADPLARFTPDPAYASTHPEPYSWAAKPALIAHGLGGVGGDKRVTNSLQAFEESYAKGYRIFEVDLIFTTDGKLVARHDWEPYMYEFLGQKVADPNARLTKAEFDALPIHGSMTPLGIEDVVTLMKAYPDIWVVTDTKSKDPAEVRAAMQAIVDAMGVDTVLAERFIVQIYNEPMLAEVRAVHPFENVIYTLYQLEGTQDQALAFAAENGIRVVAIPESMWTPAFVKSMTGRGVVPAVYTTNDPSAAEKYRASGVVLLYSDFLTP